MRAFAERNLVTTGIVGIVVLALVSLAAFYADDLPVIGGGTDYSANFGDAAGLKTGDDVSIAGVSVGSVESIALSGTHVRVGFRVKHAWVGDASTAAIKIKTALGEEYLAIDPLGHHSQNPHRSIPRSRTMTPFDIASALNGLATTTGDIDTGQLAHSLDTLTDAFANTPASVRSALDGLSRLSLTISSRDRQIASLAQQTNTLTGTLAANNANFTALINDGSALLQELQARSDAITQLLEGTRDLAAQLSGLVHDDRKILGPALSRLGRVTDILTANQGNLQKALKLIGPYYSLLNNAAGNGPWIDVYICGLFTAQNYPVLDATAKRNCSPKRGSK